MERVGGEQRHEDVEVEADRRDDGDDRQDERSCGSCQRVRERAPQAVDHTGGGILLDRPQLLLAYERERGQHGEEAHRVQDEAEPGADGCDHEARDRRPDHARAVEEAGVERDGVRQLARPDHLERQRLPARRVERERDAAERGEDVDERQASRCRSA